jgi:thioredoxin reductase
MKVEIITREEATEILGDSKVSGLKYLDRTTGKEKELKAEGIFVYIGLLPNNAIAKSLGCKTSDYGYIETGKEMKTSIEGVFAAGDITGAFAQAIVAAGQGAIAAESAYTFVKQQKAGL